MRIAGARRECEIKRIEGGMIVNTLMQVREVGNAMNGMPMGSRRSINERRGPMDVMRARWEGAGGAEWKEKGVWGTPNHKLAVSRILAKVRAKVYA